MLPDTLSERAESGEPAKSWIERSWIERMTAFSQRDRDAVIDAGRAGSGAPASDLSRVGAALRLTPHGKLVFEDIGDAPDLDARIALRLREAFARGSGEGLWRRRRSRRDPAAGFRLVA